MAIVTRGQITIVDQNDGLTVKVLELYQAGLDQTTVPDPPQPNDVTYNISTNVIEGNGNWLLAMPQIENTPIYMTSYTFNTRNPTIPLTAAGTWTDPIIVNRNLIGLKLIANGNFSRDKDNEVTPEYVQIEAIKSNVIGDVTWEAVVTGTTTPIDLRSNPTDPTSIIGSTFVGNTVYLHKNELGTSKSVNIRAELDSGYYDRITILQNKDGSDSVSVGNSNDPHQFSAYADGSVKSYTGSGTKLTVFIGATELTAVNPTNSLNNGEFKISSVTVNPLGKITASVPVEAPWDTVPDHSNMDTATDTVTVTYSIDYKTEGGTAGSIITTQTLDKRKDTAAVSLSSTANTFAYDGEGTNPTPSTPQTVTATAQNVAPVTYYQFYKNGIPQDTRSTNNIYTYTPPSSYDSMPETIGVEVYATETGGTALNSASLAINATRAGVIGQSGKVLSIEAGAAAFIYNKYGTQPVPPSSIIKLYPQNLNGTINPILLMDFEQGTFTDNSLSARTVTVQGSVTLSTSDYKYGTKSAQFIPPGSYLLVSGTTDFKFDSNYTIEAWIKQSSLASEKVILSISNALVGGFAHLTLKTISGKVRAQLQPNNGTTTDEVFIDSTTTITANTWNHVALSVVNNQAKLFINGVQEGSTTTFPLMNFTPMGLGLGGYPNGYGSATFNWNGNIDSVRVVKDLGIYTQNFVPENIGVAQTLSNMFYWTVTVNDGEESIRVPALGNNASYTYIPKSSYTLMPETLTFKAYETVIGGLPAATASIGMLATRTGDTGLDGKKTAIVNAYKWFKDGVPSYTDTTFIYNWTPEAGSGDTYFLDSSSYNNVPYILNSGYQLSPPSQIPALDSISKFGGTSLRLPNVYGGIAIPRTSDNFIFGVGDFTIETWVNLLDINDNTKWRGLVTNFSGFSGLGWQILIRNTGLYIGISQADTTSGNAVSVPYTFSNGEWYHVAITRQNGILRTFVNGILINTSNFTNVDFNDGVSGNSSSEQPSLIIGNDRTNFTAFITPYPLAGYLDDFRILKGVAAYTNNFTPRTSAIPDIDTSLPIVSTDLNFNNNLLLLDFDDNTVTLGLRDKSRYNRTVSATGNVARNTSDKKSGTASLYFDGSGDYISTSIGGSPDFQFGIEDFTIECWAKPTKTTTSVLVDAWSNAANTTGWQINLQQPSGKIRFVVGSTFVESNATILSNTWNHIAVTRRNLVLTIWLNGVSVASSNIVTGNINTPANTLAIGAQVFVRSTANDYQGFIDNIRVTRGVARYLDTFTPETVFSYLDPTVLLLHFDSTKVSAYPLDQNESAWTPTATASPGSGYSLYNIQLIVEDVVSATKTTTSWGKAVRSIFGYTEKGDIGFTGQGHFIAYIAVDIGQPPQRPENGTLFPPTNWSSAPVTLLDNQEQYQVDGFKPINTDVIVWKDPYPSYLKVGELSAITANLGNVVIGTAGSLSSGKISITDTQNAGYFLGNVNSVPKFFIGNEGDTKSLSWTGNALIIKGTEVSGSSFVTGTPLAQRITINNLNDNKLIGYNANNELIFSIGGTGVGSDDIRTLDPLILLNPKWGNNIYSVGQISIFDDPSLSSLNTISARAAASSISYYKDSSGNYPFTNYTNLIEKYYNSITNISSNIYSGFLSNATIGDTASNTRIVSGHIVSGGKLSSSSSYSGFAGKFTTFKPVATTSTNPVVLLLHFEGANNTTLFEDSSEYKRTLTRNGNAVLSQALTETASGYFDGSGDYLQISSNDQFNFTGDFTIECYVKLQGPTINPHIFQFNGSSVNFRFNIYAPNRTSFVFYSENGSGTGGNRITKTGIIDNVWYHLALVRSGTNVTMYVDGVSAGVVNSPAMPSGNLSLTLGTQFFSPITNDYLRGYIEEFRITTNVAVYTSNFTVPAIPFPNPTNTTPTALLLNFNDVNNSTTFVDSSANNRTVNVVGNTVISTAQSKFGGSSAYFPGATDYLTVPWGTDFTFGTGDFTIEMWIYPTRDGNGNAILSAAYAGGSDPVAWALMQSTTITSNSSGNNINFGSWSGSSWTGVNTTYTLPLNTWTHLAVTRSSGILRIFANGVVVGSGTFTTNIPSDTILRIGSRWDENGTVDRFQGYLDSLKIIKGRALYTAAFTPPTVEDTYDALSNISLLLHFDGSYADSSSYSRTVTVQNLTKSPAVKFGNASGYFPGISDFLSLPESSDFNFTEDFTIEAWIRPNSTNNIYSTIFSNGVTDYASGGRFLTFDSNRKINFGGYNFGSEGATAILLQSTTSLTLNSWHHVAVTRQGNTFRLFINGTLEDTETSSSISMTFNTNGTRIGGNGWSTGSAGYFDGYIDELRVIKGVAAYTASFTLPSSPFISSIAYDDIYLSKVSLLLHFDGENNSTVIVDSSPNSVPVSVEGTAKLTTLSSKFGNTACLFDGQGYLSVNSSVITTSSSLTFEFWYYITAYHNGTFYSNSTQNLEKHTATFLNSDGSIQWNYLGDTLYIVSDPNTAILNQWVHLCFIKDINKFSIYQNGILIAELAESIYYDIGNSLSPLKIGNNYANTRGFIGGIDELRITEGVARYAPSFLTPSTEFSAIEPELEPYIEPNYSSIICLHRFDKPMYDVSSTSYWTFLDSAYNIDSVRQDNFPLLDTNIKKFGRSSLYLNGQSSLRMETSNLLNFGTGDFTIEMWAYLRENSSIDTYASNFLVTHNLTKSSDFVICDASNNITTLPTFNTFNLYYRGQAIPTNQISFYIDEPSTQSGISAIIDNLGRIYILGTMFSSTSATFNIRAVYNNSTYTTTYTINQLRAQSVAGLNPSTAIGLLRNVDTIVTGIDGITYTLPEQNQLYYYYWQGLNNLPQVVTSGVSYTIDGPTLTSVTKNGLTASIGPEGVITFSGSSWTSDQESFVFRAGGLNITYTIRKNKPNIAPDGVGLRPAGLYSRLQDWSSFTSSTLLTGVNIYIGSDDNNTGTSIGSFINANGRHIHLKSSYLQEGLVTKNQWHHIALCRSGTVVSLYLNGVRQALVSDVTETIDFGTTNEARIGRFFRSTTTSVSTIGFFNGNIDQFAISNIAKYTGTTFTPSSTPIKSIYKPTMLLLKFNGANNSTTFIDSSDDINTVSLVPNSKVVLKTENPKYGSSSVYFPGNDDSSFRNAITVSPRTGVTNTKEFSLGSEDFTIEMWLYTIGRSSNQGTSILIGPPNGAIPASTWRVQLTHSTTTTTSIQLIYRDPNSQDETITATLSQNEMPWKTWNHLAISRENDIIRIFVNGNLINQGSITYSLLMNSDLCLGGSNGTLGSYNNFYYGYMDELRITKGYARYINSFVPPSTPFVTYTTSSVVSDTYSEVYLGQFDTGSTDVQDIALNITKGKVFWNNYQITSPTGQTYKALYSDGQWKNTTRSDSYESANLNTLTDTSRITSVFATDNAPVNNQWYNIINIRHRGGESTDGPFYGAQLIIPMTAASRGKLWFRAQVPGQSTWDDWTEVQTVGGGSDLRLKREIENLDLGLPFIERLRPVSFKWNHKDLDDNLTHFGFIAQDIEKILGRTDTSLVSNNLDGKFKGYKSFSNEGIVAALVKAVQELSIKIKELENKNH